MIQIGGAGARFLPKLGIFDNKIGVIPGRPATEMMALGMALVEKGIATNRRSGSLSRQVRGGRRLAATTPTSADLRQPIV
ncbi:MAG: hypothetical protein U0531_06665 [Dehalococcoidia bacterium]